MIEKVVHTGSTMMLPRDPEVSRKLSHAKTLGNNKSSSPLSAMSMGGPTTRPKEEAALETWADPANTSMKS